MSWIQVDISFLRNPKLIQFAKANGLSQMEAIGSLVKLWAYSFEFGKKPGYIPHPELLKNEVWDGVDLLEQMVDAGFVDKKKSGYFVFIFFISELFKSSAFFFFENAPN